MKKHPADTAGRLTAICKKSDHPVKIEYSADRLNGGMQIFAACDCGVISNGWINPHDVHNLIELRREVAYDQYTLKWE